jgi:MaoC dehydratase-like protein
MAGVDLDRSKIGTPLTAHTERVERGRLRFFAKAIGETDPVYTDLDAARAAGHPDLPVPPTFLACLDMARPRQFETVELLGVDIRTILHAEQAFEYHAMAYAGDTLDFGGALTDIYARKGGALQFVVGTTEVRRAGELIARIQNNFAVRGEAATP